MPKDILFVGGEGSGKSLLIRRLNELEIKTQTESTQATIPTSGVELTAVQFLVDNSFKTINIREVGTVLATRWSSYIPDAGIIVFVIDVSDSLGSAYALLLEVLATKHVLNSAHIAIVLNKTDITDPNTLSCATNILRLGELRKRAPMLRIFLGSALIGSGSSLLPELRDWLIPLLPTLQ